ncbi:MAG: hypothetical protein AB7Q00_15120 [Phycisphaerales bacterium]
MPNKYDAFLADSVGEDQYNGVLQDLPTLDPASLAKAGAVAPDVAAESQKLSASTGLPPDVVQRNMDEVKQRTQLNDYNRFVTENPELLNLARDPNFSQVAHDDTQSIGLLKNIFYKLKDSAASIVGGALVGAESMAKAGQMALGDVVISSDGLKYVPPSEIKNMAPDVIENFLMGWGKQYLNQNSGTTPFATWQDVKDADGVVETAVATGAFGIDQMITSVPYMALSLASLPASALSYSGRLLESRLENRGDSTITPEDLNIAFVGGTVAAALDRYGAEQVLGSIKALGATAVRRIARAAVAEAATEAPQEGIEYLTENLGIKPITLQALGDRMLAGAVGAGIAGGAMRGGIEVTYSGVSYIAKRNADAAQAKAAGEALGELTQAVQDSQLRERSPEQFSRLVDALAPDTELYLDPIDAGEALQQSEADIPPGLTERVADAEAHGVPVRVTAAEYATYLSSDPNLAKRVRFGRPDAMTVEEADAVQKEFDARAEAVLADADHADALKAQAVEIHNNIRDQVVATGRFRADVAGAYATLMENFYVATAARLGITPGEMYQRYPVRITPDSAVTGPESLAQIPPESFRTEQHDGGATIFATDPGTGNEIGKLETVPRGDTEIQIKFADLAPSMRGQGIGQQLIEQAYSVATQQGKKLVSDNVVSAAQLRAYEGLRRKGWTIEYSDPVKVQEILDLAARRPERAAALGVAGDAPVVTRIEPPGSLKQNIALPPWAEEYAALGGVIEPDGTTVVWHATTKDKAAKILQQGVLKRPSDAPDSYGVYFAGGRDAKSVASDYGDGTLIPVRVRVADIKPDDIFPGRRLDFSAATKNGIYRPVAVGEAALKPLGSLQQPGDRGQISFARTDGQMTGLISLFQSADLTTFLHEGGHFYLEVLSDLAAQSDTPPGVREDMEALLKWFNYNGTVEEWRALSLDERRANHEQFARGFENWLMEGKAPSEPLRRMFQRFRAWLINIYKSVAGLNVQLTDEVRDVMSRMVATQEQIQEAEQARDYAPLFDQQAASGLSPEEWATYQESAALATEYAQDQLQAKSLRNLRYLDNARSKELKRLQKENALKRAQVEAEVADEVAREPVRIAETLLKDGVTWTPGPDGNPVEVTLDGPHKLSRAKLEADYGSTADYKAVAAAAGAVDTSRVRAPWQQLPASLLTSGEGLSADEVAELVGMTSGDELVQSLLAMQPREQVISRLTDQRVLERYGEMNDPAELQRAVDQAIHNRFRARVVATELAALDASLKQLPGGLPALRRAARHAAEDVVNRTRIRDVRPGQFAAAETRAAKDARAALESGDLKTASIRKRDQMFNGYAAKNAAKMLDRVDTGLDYLRKFNRDSTRKALDPSYRDQIDKMLERFDLRKVSLTQLDKRASLLEWIKEQEADGNEPVIPDYLLDEARRKNYRNMTVQEFTDLVDAVKNIEHLGRLKQRLLTVQKQRRFAEVVADLANSINENAPEGPSKQTLERDLTLWGRVAAVTHEWLTHLRKLSSVARQVDGGKDGGVFWDNFVRPLNAAGDVELTMRRKAAVRLHELTQQVPAFNPSLARQAGQRITGPRKLYIPEIKTSLSTEARLAVALNWGNEGNRQRIMDGNKWTETQAKAVIDTLTKDEMNFVQNVFDFIGEYWPEIAAKEERVTGIRPPRVEATPIITRHGTYPGGYYPIVADSMRSEISAQQNDAELISQALKGAVTRATTRRGHTKARVGGTAPVRLDLGVITQHVSQVIHDLAWHETLIDVGRLLRAPDVSNAIRDHYGAEFTRLMRKTFDDVARGEVVARDAGEKVVNYFRVGSTIAGLGLSVNTALLQLTGFAQSVVRVGYGPMLRGLMEFSARPMESIKRVREASAFMAERSELLNRELGEITNTLDGKPRSLTRFYFMPIQAFQVAVDVPTWLAAYNKAIASPDISHDQAVAMADQAVRDAQSSGATHDLAEVQRGNAYKKLLTNFYSYFSATYQLSAESIQNFKREKSAAAAIKMASDFFMLYAVPTGLGLLIREGLRGDLDDEDELALHFFQELLANILGVFPYIREIAGAIQGYEYRGPAGLSVLAHGTAVVQQVEQGEVDEALLRAMNRFGGVAFHYPSSQVDRTVRGIIAVSEGDAGPQAVLVGPPKKE